MSISEADVETLSQLTRSTLNVAWRSEGYTSPNDHTYPWLWLWDSCFHAVLWGALGDERALSELDAVFLNQGADGFVPHMGYQADPSQARGTWGQEGASIITQPPMYAHAARVLSDAGLRPSDEIIDRCARGLDHLWRRRMREDGLLVLVHPWESGCDDSARWGSWMPDPFDKPTWDKTKKQLVENAVVEDGAAVASPDFEVPSVAFNALFAFNASELATLTGERTWQSRADEIRDGLAGRWRGNTWTDGSHSSGDVDTIEALLPLLLEGERDRDEAWGAILDPARFDAHFGPRQTSKAAPTYLPDKYWRGPTWPQLNYLLWVAARRAARTDMADHLASVTARGAIASRFAEYWNAETGDGLGAIPQSWTGLAWIMASGWEIP